MLLGAPREKASLVQYLRLGDVSGCLAHYFPHSIHASTILRLLETSLTAPYLLPAPCFCRKFCKELSLKAVTPFSSIPDQRIYSSLHSFSVLPSFLPLVFLFQVTLSSISIAVSIGQRQAFTKAVRQASFKVTHPLFDRFG